VPTTLDPQRTALVLMDFQEGVIGSLPNRDELLDRAATAIATARACGGTVAYVRVALDDADFAAVPEHNKNFSALRGRAASFGPGDFSTAVPEPIAPQPQDIVVRKTRVGAFSTTDLDDQLRRRGIDTLLLGGIATSGVVLSTVRDAADRDYRLILLTDLCADRDPEVHDILVGRVLPKQADAATTADLPALLGDTTTQRVRASGA
jgi:nicotinamidase-related amidase